MIVLIAWGIYTAVCVVWFGAAVVAGIRAAIKGPR